MNCNNSFDNKNSNYGKCMALALFGILVSAPLVSFPLLNYREANALNKSDASKIINVPKGQEQKQDKSSDNNGVISPNLATDKGGHLAKNGISIYGCKEGTAGKGGIAIFGCANGGLGPNGGRGGIAIFGIANAGNSGSDGLAGTSGKDGTATGSNPGTGGKGGEALPGREVLVVTEE